MAMETLLVLPPVRIKWNTAGRKVCFKLISIRTKHKEKEKETKKDKKEMG
jgi:hypothetical protein